MYFAHSVKNAPQSDWQSLREHLLRVAELADDMGAPLGLGRAAYYAGLYHDLGKYSEKFQQRLNGGKDRFDHSTAGAAEILRNAAREDKVMAELIAYCVAGHHAGLPDRNNASPACLDRRLEDNKTRLDPVWRSECPHTVGDLFPKPKKKFGKEDLAFSLSVMGRMIFSCLVDADFKDTEAFYGKLENRRPDRDWPCLQERLPEFRDALGDALEGKRDRSSAVNRLRRDIRDHALAKAGDEPGLFTLTVPTGGGKTLTSLGFALEHALIHGHRRIIYAIPFTSIIDQTARIFRSILGGESVLEHHSAIDEEGKTHGERQQRDKLKLAMEDWAAPVVVTTNVQFFESLFSAKPSRCRKLHNIAGSVIILDEAQTIPLPVLRPAMRMLRELAQHYGCTIVLCTATQPALDERKLEGGLPLDETRELAPKPHELARRMRRASIRHEGALSNRDLCAGLAEQPRALVIVNSRKHALELYRDAVEAGLEGCVHLTTRQHAADRRRIIERMRERLKTGAPCRVIATSLIEAGVDVDFPKVWRAETGLDQIVQAAGRCNREGKRNPCDSVVSVFAAPDYRPPPEIGALAEDMKRILGKHEDLLSPKAIEDYFGEVYWRKGDRLDKHDILKQFKIYRRSDNTDFSYRTVGEKFRLIEKGLAPVIIETDETSETIKKLGVADIPSVKIARELQQYIVQIPPRDRNVLIDNGHAGYECPELRGDQFVVLKTKDLYGNDVGLIWEDADNLGMENSVI